MKYQVNIIRYEGDKPILLKSLIVGDKAHIVSWDNKTYPVKTELVAYVDTDKKIGYIFFEHDNINQHVLLNEKEIKELTSKEVPTDKGTSKEPTFISLRLKAISALRLTATELDMFVNQNVIANIFARLKNFGTSMNKTTLLLVICMLVIGGMAGYFAGSNLSAGKEIIVYRNATIPSV